MRRYTSLLLVVLCCAVAFGDDGDASAPANPSGRKQISSKEQTREFTETFLRALVTSRPYDAFNLMKMAMPDSESDIDATRASTEQLIEQVRPGYGRITGFELLDTKSLGKSFVRYDYLLKFERNALHCRALYYQSSNVWLPVGVWFKESLDDLFDDLGK